LHLQDELTRALTGAGGVEILRAIAGKGVIPSTANAQHHRAAAPPRYLQTVLAVAAMDTPVKAVSLGIAVPNMVTGRHQLWLE
jgi:hypothetical protein